MGVTGSGYSGSAVRGACAALLVLGALLVSAAPAAAVADDVSVLIPLPANHGLHAKLETSEEGFELEFHRKREAAFYRVRTGKVSAEGINITFGRIGRFEAEFRPTETREIEPPPECRGEPLLKQVGWFVGDFRFHGERGFVQIDAERVKGRLAVEPEWKCSRRLPLAAAEPEQATISARSPDRSRAIVVFGARGGEDGGAETGFIAALSEHREGMQIGRFLFVNSRGAGFEFDHEAGTALVEPPFPFSGRARFARHRGGANTWTGSLNVPLLGAGRVHFAGLGFVATLKPDLPNFE